MKKDFLNGWLIISCICFIIAALSFGYAVIVQGIDYGKRRNAISESYKERYKEESERQEKGFLSLTNSPEDVAFIKEQREKLLEQNASMKKEYLEDIRRIVSKDYEPFWLIFFVAFGLGLLFGCFGVLYEQLKNN